MDEGSGPTNKDVGAARSFHGFAAVQRSLGTISSSRCQTTRASVHPLGRDDESLTRICFSYGRASNNGQAMQPPGGARRDRTDDLLLAKQALSQLSYGPAPVIGTLWVPSPSEKWWAWEDLNFRPHAYQARALTN